MSIHFNKNNRKNDKIRTKEMDRKHMLLLVVSSIYEAAADLVFAPTFAGWTFCS